MAKNMNSPHGESRPSVDIIVCVHNSLNDVRACLQSIARTLEEGSRIIIVDDGSDASTRDFCAQFSAKQPAAMLIRHEQGSGFTKAANAGLRVSDADIAILLNSDTIAPQGWVGKLVRCLHSGPCIGIAGPLSNAASWQSVPYMTDPVTKDMAVNHYPADVATVDEMDALCARWAQGRPYPVTSLVNGFCFAIRRSVIDAIGLLDEENFPSGYGEENDFCLRAGRAGFMMAIAVDAFVFHAKSRSYSNERRKELSAIGGARLRELHGETLIKRCVSSMRNNPILVDIRKQAVAHYAVAASKKA